MWCPNRAIRGWGLCTRAIHSHNSQPSTMTHGHGTNINNRIWLRSQHLLEAAGISLFQTRMNEKAARNVD